MYIKTRYRTFIALLSRHLLVSLCSSSQVVYSVKFMIMIVVVVAVVVVVVDDDDDDDDRQDLE